MLKVWAAITATAAAVGLGACEQGNTGQLAGAGIGGLLGGVLGSQIGDGTGQVLATAAGVALGAYLGSEFGSRLDSRDRALSEQAAVGSYGNGATRNWSNPETGVTGTVRPVSNAQNGAGHACQIQETSVTLQDGSTQTTRYNLCRGADGQYYTQPV